ncbi:MAG: putative oxidoreductase, Rieske [2Fe-2S] region [Actinomycetia bacterium]|nr:putative oxidoreductase, Rieske [2Fe-2S] region [Actinomycetes bacterium]
MMLGNLDPALRRCWLPVARSSEVGADPVKVTVLGEDWVLVRLPAGLAAYVDRCPHRFAPLSAGSVDGDVLRCGYHGWCFDEAGTCTEIPSMGSTDLRPARANAGTPGGLAERHGMIFLAPDEPVTELLEVPEADDPTFDHGTLPVITATVGAALLIDNFLDMSHFPFLHAATIGTEEATVVEDVDIERRGHGMTARSRHPFPNHEDPAVATGERALVQHRRLVYEYRAPFSISLRIDYEEAGGTNVVDFFVQPVDAETCRIFTTIHRNDLDGDDARLAEAVSFEMKILDEDLRLQERYVDRRLPLDLTAEVHVKADRITVELRRILAELVKETA